MLKASGQAMMGKLAGISYDNYLSMNILKYKDIIITLVNPVLLMLFSGWGFLVGPEFVTDTQNVALGRAKRLLISFGGVLSLLPLLILSIVLSWIEHSHLVGIGFAMVAYLIMFSIFVNFLPLPFTDMWNFVYPEIPDKFRDKILFAMNHKFYKYACYLLTILVIWLMSFIFHEMALTFLRLLLVPKNSMLGGLGLLFTYGYQVNIT